MTTDTVRVNPSWLALREPADAAARSRDLVDHLKRALPANNRMVIHDLGSGTGAMGRWLAPQLTGPQHWIAHDRDPDLLALAAADVPRPAANGTPVTVEARCTDISQLRPDELGDATLITASALLDMLTADEMSRLAGTCAGARCPVLLTLSVTGRVAITPGDPLDRRVAAAFNDDQRRATQRGRLLGPDAIAYATHEFGRLGAEVLVRPSPWRLGSSDAGLIAEWFTGWLEAACEQEVELVADRELYTRQRLAQLTAGQLAVTVDHADLLVLP
ncbi:MAG: SAM-dependent methyltransferase [Solirubrobacteraceae bacterium]